MHKLYTSPTCGYCRQLKEYLGDHDVAYKEINVAASEENMKEFQKLGYMGVPIFVYQYPDPDLTEVLVGFNRRNFDRLFEKPEEVVEPEPKSVPKPPNLPVDASLS